MTRRWAEQYPNIHFSSMHPGETIASFPDLYEAERLGYETRRHGYEIGRCGYETGRYRYEIVRCGYETRRYRYEIGRCGYETGRHGYEPDKITVNLLMQDGLTPQQCRTLCLPSTIACRTGCAHPSKEQTP